MADQINAFDSSCEEEQICIRVPFLKYNGMISFLILYGRAFLSNTHDIHVSMILNLKFVCFECVSTSELERFVCTKCKNGKQKLWSKTQDIISISKTRS